MREEHYIASCSTRFSVGTLLGHPVVGWCLVLNTRYRDVNLVEHEVYWMSKALGGPMVCWEQFGGSPFKYVIGP